MPRRSSSLDIIQQQLRRVRRRHNVRQVQRTAYLLVAALATAATLVMLLALRGGVRLFASGSAAVVGLVVLAVGLLARDARRRFLPTARAAAWADRQGNLQGRLVTLLEIGAPDRGREEAYFLPLLLEENVQRLPTWRPDRLVPRWLPLRPLAAALGATGALVLAVTLSPLLRPASPPAIYLNEPVGNLAPIDLTPDRVLIAPARQLGSPSSGEPGVSSAPPGGGSSSRPSFLARLQERIRERAWGAASERPGEATRATDRRDAPLGEPAHAKSGGDANEALSGAAHAVGSRSGQELLKVARAVRRSHPGHGGPEEAPGDASPPESRGEGDAEPHRTGTDGAAAGAGTGTSPDLFGPPSAGRLGERDAFELALTAPGRGSAPTPTPPSGEAPPAAEDERPALAAGQRSETPLTKMPVPPAYESLVRRLFAHGAGAVSP